MSAGAMSARAMTARTMAIMRKEFLHIVRDPRTLVIIFMIPIIQMVLLGYAATNDVDDIFLAVLDGSHSAESRELVSKYESTGYFEVVGYVDSQSDLQYMLDHGDAKAGLIIPADYGSDVAGGDPADIGIIIDGSDPTVANAILAAALQTGQTYSRELGLIGGQGRRSPLDVRTTVWYNPDLRSVNYMIPALMGLILQFMATLVPSMAIVREREMGTIEQLIVTPIQPVELIVGKVAPYLLVAFFNFLEVLIVGIVWFKVPIHGDLILLLELSALFLIGSLSIGILISSASKTQQEAMMMSFLFLMPSIFLSGFLFPLDAMPRILQAISYAIPLRYMLIIVRGIVLKGVDFAVLRGEIVVLGIFCVIVLVLAARRFRKSLD